MPWEEKGCLNNQTINTGKENKKQEGKKMKFVRVIGIDSNGNRKTINESIAYAVAIKSIEQFPHYTDVNGTEYTCYIQEKND